MNHGVGTVCLIGAGPGDADLITLRGLRLLRRADVVVYDRLVSRELLAEARPGAELIDAGKHPGFERVTQREINDLLVDRARRGLEVVRLKGGDPLIFGRGGEEAAHCAAAGVPLAIVPGVSSVHAVPASAGIPITHRGVSRSCVVITGQTEEASNGAGLPYRALAAIDTVVILMGRSSLGQIAGKLIQAGRAEDTPAACIETGCTPDQRVVRGTLASIAALADDHELRAPVTTVIGQVAAMDLQTVDGSVQVKQAV